VQSGSCSESTPPLGLGVSWPGRGRIVAIAVTARGRRRIFAITSAGLEALAAWLGRPVDGSTELRDLRLVQLFFMDLASDEARLHLAESQLEIHEAKLSAYEEDARIERRGRTSGAGLRIQWSSATRYG